MKWTLEHEGITSTVEADEVTATEVLRGACYSMLASGFPEKALQHALDTLAQERHPLAITVTAGEPVNLCASVEEGHTAICVKESGHSGPHSWEDLPL